MLKKTALGIVVVLFITELFFFAFKKGAKPVIAADTKTKPPFNVVANQIMAQFHEDTGKFEYAKGVGCEDVLKVKLYEIESLKTELSKLTAPPATPVNPGKKPDKK